jgi:dethiobiotin synthetase
MSAVFITATGTDIGKTYLATGMIRQFRAAGRAVSAIKPVATGFDPARPEASDAGQLLTALGKPITAEEIARISPWRFAAPLSPDLAARREGRTVDFDALVAFSRDAMRDQSRIVLIEGIGGIMVPLDSRHTVLDWMCALDIPLLLVAGSYLGSISHTLTCLEVLKNRNLTVRAVVVNETPGASVSIADTIASVSQFAKTIAFVGLSRQSAQVHDEKFSEIFSLL